jgi:hypothetical protein
VISKVKKKLILLIFIIPALAAAGEFFARRSVFPVPDRADLFELFTLEDAPVFFDEGAGRMRTRPELTALDNSAVSFPAMPGPGTERVICVGGSTTAGWPFHPRGGYPERMRLYLEDFYGGGSAVEVINAGFHNFDSRREISVSNQLAGFKPDIALVYSGYNELQTYYARGPLGALRAPHRSLMRRSALYNWTRYELGLSGARMRGNVSLPLLSYPQKEKMFSRFRRNLTASAKALKAGGASVYLLELVWAPGYTPPFPGPEYISRMNSEIRQAGLDSGAAVIKTGEFISADDFVDAEHLTLSGYAKLGLGLARVLCAGPLAAQGCRQGPLRGEAQYARLLETDDPAWLAGVRARLALVYCLLSLEAKASGQLELAEASSPGTALNSLAMAGNRKVLELLALTDEKLGYPDRAAAARSALAKLK